VLKKIFRRKLFLTTPPRRLKNFGQCTILGVQKFFGCEKRLVKKYKTQILQILREHVRCAPAPRYNCPHLHFYFMLFCAPGSHFTHPHLFHLSFSHPRSRRKVPNSAVWTWLKSWRRWSVMVFGLDTSAVICSEVDENNLVCLLLRHFGLFLCWHSLKVIYICMKSMSQFAGFY
jgi:hypothetical protein